MIAATLLPLLGANGDPAKAIALSSMLALLGTRIDALAIRRGPALSDESGGWYRLARGVSRRTTAAIVPGPARALWPVS